MPEPVHSQETPAETPEENPIQKLRDEFQRQFTALKTSTEEAIASKDKQISELTEQLKQANAALLKSAFTPAPAPTPEKSEEEIYQDRIQSLYEKSKKYSEMI